MTVRVVSTGADPFSRQTTTFEGVTFVLSFAYSTRAACWYLSIADASGVDVVNGVKLICSVPLLRKCSDPRAPAGDLLVVSSSADTSPPDLPDLLPSGRCQLLYITSDWLAAIQAGNAADLAAQIALGPLTAPASTYGADPAALATGTTAFGGVAIVSTPAGVRGKPGTAGVQGLQGAPGSQGIQGIQGIQGTPAAYVVVYVNAAASPYAAAAYQVVVVDTTAGSVVVNLPVLTLGQPVEIKHASLAASLATHTLTINPPAGVTLEQSPPLNGTTASHYLIAGTESAGTDVSFFNGGISGVYNLK